MCHYGLIMNLSPPRSNEYYNFGIKSRSPTDAIIDRRSNQKGQSIEIWRWPATDRNWIYKLWARLQKGIFFISCFTPVILWDSYWLSFALSYGGFLTLAVCRTFCRWHRTKRRDMQQNSKKGQTNTVASFMCFLSSLWALAPKTFFLPLLFLLLI